MIYITILLFYVGFFGDFCQVCVAKRLMNLLFLMYVLCYRKRMFMRDKSSRPNKDLRKFLELSLYLSVFSPLKNHFREGLTDNIFFWCCTWENLLFMKWRFTFFSFHILESNLCHVYRYVASSEINSWSCRKPSVFSYFYDSHGLCQLFIKYSYMLKANMALLLCTIFQDTVVQNHFL